MKKYILQDLYDKTEKYVSEKDLKDIYSKTMEEIIYNWKDCGDEKLVEGLIKEKENVYNVSIDYAIKRIEEDNWFYNVKECE